MHAGTRVPNGSDGANHQLEWPRGKENLREANQSDSRKTGADPNPQMARILKREALLSVKILKRPKKKEIYESMRKTQS